MATPSGNSPAPTQVGAAKSVAASAGNAGAVQPKPGALQGSVSSPFTITSVHEKGRYLKLFLYGDYGTGKTWLAASAAHVPQMKDILLIDAEAGDLTVATSDFAENIDVVRATTFKEVARVQEFLKAHCSMRDKGDLEGLAKLETRLRGEEVGTADVKQYHTVIIDSLSEVETFSMYQLLGITDSTRLDEETAQAEWSEYKRNHGMILRLVRAFRDLPMNVIMISAAQYTQDEMKRFVFQPALTGKLSKQVQGFMDMVGFQVVNSEGDEVKRRLYVQPSVKFNAKNRFGVFKGAFFEDPSLFKILQAVDLLDANYGKSRGSNVSTNPAK